MYPTDAATDAAIAAGKIKAAFLVDMYCKTGAGDELTLRAWDWPGVAYYPGTVDLDGSTADQAYDSLYGRIVVSLAIRMAMSLSSEPLEIQLDGSRSADDDDLIGQWVDADWHQRRIRVRQIMLDWQTEEMAALPLREWRGLMDHRELIEPATAQEPRIWNLSCQAGLFRVRGNRLKTRSHADQQLRSAGDMFYSQTAGMVGRPLNWGKSPSNLPGTATGAGGANAGGVSGRTIVTRYGNSSL